MSYKIEIARKHLSIKGQDDGVQMYFDAQIHTVVGNEEVAGPRLNGFRLVKGEHGNFLGFPFVKGKDGKRYPSIIPPKKMSEALLARAEQEFQQLKRSQESHTQ